MGVVSVRYLQRDEPTAGEKNTAAGEKNTAAGEESGAAVGAFLKNIPQKKYTKWLDYDKIIQSVVFRTRRSGDYLTIDDNFSKKSLKKYMIEEKIPANERNSMMVLADGNHIIWVPDEEEKRATILDISGGGARFVSEEKFEANQFVLMELELISDNMDKQYHIKGRIVGWKKLEYREPRYETRIEFIMEDNKVREDIIRYIFEEERKKRRNEKG